VACAHLQRPLFPSPQGYNEEIVDALVDFGVPFECVFKASGVLLERDACRA
jgi:hypothetical protein